MEITPWTVYWITRLDAIGHASVPFIVVGSSGTIIAVVAYFVGSAVGGSSREKNRKWKRRHGEDDDDYTAEAADRCVALAKTGLRLAAPLLLLSVGAAVLIPTTKEACAILVIPAVANSEDVQALGGDIVTLAREWVEELKPGKEAK